MDLRTLSPFKGGSIHQYTPPRCFELVGKRLELIMDDGYDFILNFTDNDRLEWHREGEKPASAAYTCLKADATTYFVCYLLENTELRTDHVFVLDMENMLVTRLISTVGTNPRWPYLISSDIEFGAIAGSGGVKPYPRHGFTSDMNGNVVQWTYGAEMSTVHVYYCDDFYRITYPRDRVASSEGERSNNAFSDILKALPSSDEPVHYVKIKNGLYFISLTEKNGEKILGAKMGYRSDTLCFLQDYRTGRNVGRGFGTSTSPEGVDREIHIMIGAFGRVIEPVDDDLKKLLTTPNPYLV